MVNRHNGPFRLFEDSFEELFKRTLSRRGLPTPATRAFPALNAWEDDEHLFIEAEIPGIGLEDLDITFFDGELTLKGQRKKDEAEGTTWHRQERGTGEFSRTLRLPFEVNVEQVAADLSAGVLTIKLPKAERAKPHKIEVRQND